MFSMRITLFVSLFLLIQIIWSQQKEASVIDSISIDKKLNNTLKDTIVSKEKIVLDEIKKQDSTSKSQKKTKKISKKKKLIPFIKPMDKVGIYDYKIMFMDGSVKEVDTSLSIEGEYSFNFLRKDYFELLTFPNMGEAFNKMGYDFHKQPFTPQMGFRVKHFGYFEKEDIAYYEVPSPYTGRPGGWIE